MKKLFLFLFAALMSAGMGWALEPLSGDTWDDNTKTLTVNSTPQGDYYHDQNEIKRVIISSFVTEIGENAFSDCFSLESVFAYDGLQVIDQSAFFSCPKLESVILPSTLREVRFSAFASCYNLKYVTINAPSLGDYAEYAFDDTHENLKIYVPEASLATYKTNWSAYADHFQAIPSSIAVGDTLKVGDVMYSATDVYVDAGYLRFLINGSALHTITAIKPNGAGSNILVYFTPYAEQFYPSGSYAALTNWFDCPSEYTSGDVTAITVVSGTGTLDDPFVIDYVKPAPAATEVIITQNDFPEWGTSFTKDGVTVTAGYIDGSMGDLVGGGSFSTTLGNFTKIVVYAGEVSPLGEGWSGNYERQTWTGNASSVSFYDDILSQGEEVNLMFTIEESAPEPEPAGVTVVFAANDKTVERTVTLPHDFSCSYSNKNGELDAIIKELYEISAGHCSDDNYPVASGNEAVLAGSNGSDNYITISAAFEGTATVSGWYWNSDAYDGDGDWMNYSLTISIKGDEPEPDSETLETNKELSVYTGLHFKVTPNPGREGDSNGFWVSYTDHATISALNGETILSAELTVGDGEEYIPYFGASKGQVSHSGSVITISDVNATSVELLMTYIAALQISQVKIYYSEPVKPTAISNTTVDTKAVKMIKNGQLLIISNGNIYNALGAEMR